MSDKKIKNTSRNAFYWKCSSVWESWSDYQLSTGNSQQLSGVPMSRCRTRSVSPGMRHILLWWSSINLPPPPILNTAPDNICCSGQRSGSVTGKIPNNDEVELWVVGGGWGGHWWYCVDRDGGSEDQMRYDRYILHSNINDTPLLSYQLFPLNPSQSKSVKTINE